MRSRTEERSTPASASAVSRSRSSRRRRASFALARKRALRRCRSQPPFGDRTRMQRPRTASFTRIARARATYPNRALRQARTLGVPVVYFIATRPGAYEAIFPCFIARDDPAGRAVLVQKGKMRGDFDEPEPIVIDDPLERRYVNRDVRVRVHQRRFRWRVLPAYRNQCAICRLKEVTLLDAAHIVGDLEASGEPTVDNGLSLCSIHHRAFD